LLSLIAHFNWQLLQYDVKNAFLHGDLDEEIYTNIPPGFEGDTSNKECTLRKALYRLKQFPRAWFGRFPKVIKDFGYKQSQGNHNIFIKHSTDKRKKHELKQRLAKEFEMKELGKPKYFLGIEVAYSTEGISISQEKHMIDLLTKIGKLGCNPTSTPM